MVEETPRLIVEHPQWSGRNVTLICGPPGAGKTTLALSIHPRTLDIGEMPPGTPRERMRQFGRQAYRIGRAAEPNIAVVRGAPTDHEREHQQGLARPSRTIIMLTPAHVCHERIDKRARPGTDGRDIDDQHQAVDAWWSAWSAENARTEPITSQRW